MTRNAEIDTSHVYRTYFNIGPDEFEITGPQMVLTLKLITFAWNVFDGRQPLEVCQGYFRYDPCTCADSEHIATRQSPSCKSNYYVPVTSSLPGTRVCRRGPQLRRADMFLSVVFTSQACLSDTHPTLSPIPHSLTGLSSMKLEREAIHAASQKAASALAINVRVSVWSSSCCSSLATRSLTTNKS